MSGDWRDALRALDLPDNNNNDNQPDDIVDDNRPRQTVRLDIVTERKGRKGKAATIICGFTLPDDDIAAIAADMRRTMGTGGSVRGGEILLQGERAADALRYLTTKGFKARII